MYADYENVATEMVKLCLLLNEEGGGRGQVGRVQGEDNKDNLFAAGVVEVADDLAGNLADASLSQVIKVKSNFRSTF